MADAPLQRVTPDPAAARRQLSAATQLLAAAELPNMGAVASDKLLHDAVHNAVTATLWAAGVRMSASMPLDAVALDALRDVLPEGLAAALQRFIEDGSVGAAREVVAAATNSI